MKHLFLLNPAAGKRNATEELTGYIRRCCHDNRGMAEGEDFIIRVSEKPGDITAWAKEAAATGEELRVYACGGDGTLNEAVNGVAGYANVSLTHVPRGSGNDFIRLFTATEPFRDLEALVTTTKEVQFDLIAFGDDYSLNACSMGLDARIGTEVAKYKRLPLVSGHGAYLLSTLVNVVKGLCRHYRVEVNGEIIDGEQTMIFVGSGRWYGGGFQPVPEADPTDGKLDVLMVKKVSRLTVMKVIGPYKAGRYQEFPQLIRHFVTDRVKIICDKPEPVNLDGELRTAKVAEFRIAPCKLRFFYPESVELIRDGRGVPADVKIG